MAYNSKYTGAEVEELLDKVKDSQLWGYECFAVKKEGMDDPDTLKQEIEAFIEAGGGDADPLIKLIQDAGLGNAYIHLVNSDEGATTLTINGASVTLGAGETYSGYVDDWSDIDRDNYYLKSILVIGNVSTAYGSATNSGSTSVRNNTVEEVATYCSSDYSRAFEWQHYGLGSAKRIVFRGGKQTSTLRFINRCQSVESIDLSQTDLSQTTSLYYFANTASKLTSVKFGSERIENVTTMYGMFWGGCYALTSLDLSMIYPSKVTTMGYLVSSCTALVALALSDDWNMESVTSTIGMFGSCSSLTTVTGTISNIKISLDISDSPLTRESALVFINGLSDEPSEESPTLSLSSTTKGYLTDDDIKIATDKGWTIA